jgi:hypothetical protein
MLVWKIEEWPKRVPLFFICLWGEDLEKGLDRWLRADGIALIAGWRRRMDVCEVAKKMKVGLAKLMRWAAENEAIGEALCIDGEAVDFMVEEIALKKALDGDLKAVELWLKYWGQKADVRGQMSEERGADYAMLAEMIKGSTCGRNDEL